MRGRDPWPNPFTVLVGLLLWLSMTRAQRRALWAAAERRAVRDQLRVIDGGQRGA